MHPDWGLILAIIGIVLIIPGGIVAAMLTPRVDRWWATTSRRRMVKRRVKLSRRLQRLEEMDLQQLSERRWLMVGLLALSVYFIGAAASLATLDFIPTTHNPVVLWMFHGASSIQVHILQFVFCFGAVISAFFATLGLVRVYQDSADKRRRATKRELANLETLLGPPGQGFPTGPPGSGPLDRFIKR